MKQEEVTKEAAECEAEATEAKEVKTEAAAADGGEEVSELPEFAAMLFWGSFAEFEVLEEEPGVEGVPFWSAGGGGTPPWACKLVCPLTWKNIQIFHIWFLKSIVTMTEFNFFRVIFWGTIKKMTLVFQTKNNLLQARYERRFTSFASALLSLLRWIQIKLRPVW